MAVYAVLFGLWQLQPESVPFQVHAADVALAAVCLFPTARWYARGAVGPPMFEMVCLSYGVQYALPLYLQPNQANFYTGNAFLLAWSTTYHTLLIASLGISSMIATYYCVTERSRLRQRLPKINLRIEDGQLSRYILFAFVLGLGTNALSVLHLTPDNSGPLGSTVRFLMNQSVVGLALLAFRVYSGTERRMGWRYLLYVWLSVATVLGFATGMLESAFVPGVLVLLVRWQSAGRLPWRPVLAGALAFLVLQPIKQEYRAQTWGAQQVSLDGRVTLWYQDAADFVGSIATGDVGQNVHNAWATSTSRLDLLHEFVLVDTLTPSSVPYFGGETYKYLGYSWIPRLFWPDKPSTQNATDDLALSYGLMPADEVGKVSIGLGFVAEAYANFGTIGLVIIMAIQGLLFALLSLMLNGPESHGGRAVFLATMVWYLNGIATSTAIMLGGLLQQTLPAVLALGVLSPTGRGQGDSHTVTRHGNETSGRNRASRSTKRKHLLGVSR